MEETPLFKALKEVSKVSFRQEKILVVFFIFTLFLNFFLWFFIFFSLQRLKEITILHYSVIPGVGLDKIGPKRNLFKMPLFGFFVLLLNFIFTNFLFQKGEKMLGYFLIITSFFVNLFLIVSSILILTL